MPHGKFHTFCIAKKVYCSGLAVREPTFQLFGTTRRRKLLRATDWKRLTMLKSTNVYTKKRGHLGLGVALGIYILVENASLCEKETSLKAK